jgi:hypothetical protein
MNRKTFAAAALALGLLLPLAPRAQEPPDRGVSDTKPLPGVRKPTRPVRNAAQKAARQSCLAKAGVSRAVLEQRRALQEKTRSEIEAACVNSALSEQQKREQIRQIQLTSRQQLQAMLTPTQLAELQACQRANAHPRAGGPHVGGPHPGGSSPGPCGFLH